MTVPIRPAFSASGRGNKHNEVSQNLSQTAATVATVRGALDQLLPIHANVATDLATLSDAPSAARYRDRRQAAWRYYNGHYLTMLATLAARPADDLRADVTDLETRLAHGWNLEGDNVEAILLRLIAELEIVSDALMGVEVCRKRWGERAERLGKRWADG